MPRKYDKYGFNRQYLRRPCTRANPFPHKLVFVDGFGHGALIQKVRSAPPTNDVDMPQANVPAGNQQAGRSKRMKVTKALSRFVGREVTSLGESGTMAFIVGEIGEAGGPLASAGGALAGFGVVMVGETAQNLVKLAYDLVHKEKPVTRSQTKKRGHDFDLMQGLD